MKTVCHSLRDWTIAKILQRIDADRDDGLRTTEAGDACSFWKQWTGDPLSFLLLAPDGSDEFVYQNSGRSTMAADGSNTI